MSDVQSRAADRNAIWDALPQSERRAETAAEIADRAGVNRRSCGTKLAAMFNSDYRLLGLRRIEDRDRRQFLWWRETPDARP